MQLPNNVVQAGGLGRSHLCSKRLLFLRVNGELEYRSSTKDS
jgi:hypothetical protein